MSLHLAYLPMFDLFRRKQRAPLDAANVAARAADLLRQGRYPDALAAFDALLTADPANVDGLVGRGNARFALGQPAKALDDFAAAFRSSPSAVGAAYNCAFVLRTLGRRDEAIAYLDKALAVKPDYADALNLRGVALTEKQRFAQALSDFERLAQSAPDYPDVLGNIAYTSAFTARFDVQRRVRPRIEERLRQGTAIAPPFVVVSQFDDPELQRTAARLQSARWRAATPPVLRNPPDDRIRVAYLSTDFHDHAVAYLMAGVVEHHDRARFEITGISFGPGDERDMRKRLVKAFDRFVEARAQSDDEVVTLMRDARIDIAVDLMGHTGTPRTGVLARRAAPVQVNYLGYPGTMGAPFIDYILADRFVIPPDAAAFYDEHVVWMPRTFQANDDRRPAPAAPPAREALGLSDDAFVFCCFNNAYKISPRMFETWMRILARVERSALWLFGGDDDFQSNVRAAATASGVDASRIVFASKAPYAEYLARYGAADLFLDTLPFNGGTTASDALWAGLPVLTCAGRAFAARMAGSLLTAAGLPQLVTASLADYEERAVDLAHDASLLAACKSQLAGERARGALFDTARFTRELESAYATMHELARAGAPPRAFAV